MKKERKKDELLEYIEFAKGTGGAHLAIFQTAKSENKTWTVGGEKREKEAQLLFLAGSR
jgi:hypothetical protein